jgi:hypothetical protein
VLQFCLSGGSISVERVLALRKAVREEVLGKISKWGQVNYVWCVRAAQTYLKRGHLVSVHA